MAKTQLTLKAGDNSYEIVIKDSFLYVDGKKINPVDPERVGGVTDKYGTTRWYNKDGGCHRDNDLPAMIHADGDKFWYQHGKIHRDNDKPAIEYIDGQQQWFQHGKIHRDNDKPAIIKTNGDKLWYQHNMVHRDDKPAIMRYRDGKLVYIAYWLNDVLIDELGVNPSF